MTVWSPAPSCRWESCGCMCVLSWVTRWWRSLSERGLCGAGEDGPRGAPSSPCSDRGAGERGGARKEREGNCLSFLASWAPSLLIPLPNHPHADFGVNFISELGRRPGAGRGLQAPGVTNACPGPATLLLSALQCFIKSMCVLCWAGNMR